MMNFKSVMVTGHRPNVFNSEQREFAQSELDRLSKKLKEDFGMEEAISGMALGADTWCAQSNLKNDVLVAAYIPFEAQSSRWKEEDKIEWQRIRSLASREVVVADSFSVRNLHARNDAMIKDSNLAIAVWNQLKESGGTYSAVQKLKKKKMPIIIVDMNNLKAFKWGF